MEVIVLSFALTPLVACLASIVASAVHTADEVWGRGGPLWEYAEPLVGKVRYGGLLFLGLFIALSGLAVFGYGYGFGWAVSLLIGLRVGDLIASHVVLASLFKRPNPGLWSAAALYSLEAVAAFCLFDINWPWFCLGFLVFATGWKVAMEIHRRK